MDSNMALAFSLRLLIFSAKKFFLRVARRISQVHSNSGYFQAFDRMSIKNIKDPY